MKDDPKSLTCNYGKHILHSSFFISRCLYNWAWRLLQDCRANTVRPARITFHLVLMLHTFNLGSLSFPVKFSSFLLSYLKLCSVSLLIMLHGQEDFLKSASSEQTLIVRIPQKIIHHGDLGWKMVKIKGISEQFRWLFAVCLSLEVQRTACFMIKGSQSKQDFWNHIPKHLGLQTISNSPISPPQTDGSHCHQVSCGFL